MAETTASLTVLGGPLAGLRCVLPADGSVTIGSAPGSTLQLDLPTVSPFHARLAVEAGRVIVHDTGADRALHVNDNPLEPGGTVLRNGDILWLGAPGEDDVVMLQYMQPRRPVAAPSPAVPAAPEPSPASPAPATPTPEVETVALWTLGSEPSSPPPPRAAAEPVREEPTGHEETMAILPEGAVVGGTPPASTPREEEALVVAEPSLPGATEEEVFAAAEPAVFVGDTEAVVVEASEVESEPSPTLLMTSPEEMAEPQAVSIDFSDTAAVEPEAVPSAPPVVEPAPPVVEPEPAPPPPVAPAPPPLPVAPVSPPPIAAKPPGSVPPLPAARPSAPARPAAPRPSPRVGRPPGPPPARRDVPHAARPAPPPTVAEPEAVEAAAPSPGGRRSVLLALAGFAGVLVVAGLGWVAWRFLAGRPSEPRPTPTPIARATAPPETRPRPTPTPEAVEPTAEPAVTPTATPTPVVTPRPGATPTPAATPTPRATPTPAAARATPTPPPTPAGPSAEALRAQQAAAQAQSLLAQAETAIGARQYDAAVSHLDGALRLEPGNARATSLRADAVRRRDLARRRFVPGRTAVQTQKAQKGGELAGFDTGDADLRKSPDFLGRVEFEMSPASGLETGDAWTLRVYVVNEGKKPIRVQGVTVGTSVNGSGSGGPVSPRVREIAPQQRSLVAEATGTWREGTTSWTTEAAVAAGKGESLTNTLTWR